MEIFSCASEALLWITGKFQMDYLLLYSMKSPLISQVVKSLSNCSLIYEEDLNKSWISPCTPPHPSLLTHAASWTCCFCQVWLILWIINNTEPISRAACSTSTGFSRHIQIEPFFIVNVIYSLSPDAPTVAEDVVTASKKHPRYPDPDPVTYFKRNLAWFLVWFYLTALKLQKPIPDVHLQEY